MLSVVEPSVVRRQAPPVGGVRRELTLVIGGRAPRLGGFRAELGAATENAAPLFEVPRAEPDPAKDAAPPLRGVERGENLPPRTNVAAIAAGVSVFAHVLVLAWALHTIQSDGAAAGGDLSPVVIEGVSVVLVDEPPSPLREAKTVEEAAAVLPVDRAPAPKAGEKAEVAALTQSKGATPVAEAVPADAAVLAVDSAVARPVQEARVAPEKAPPAEAPQDIGTETLTALADDVPAAAAPPDPSAPLAASDADDTAAAPKIADSLTQPVEAEIPEQPESAEALARDLPANMAPATDLYRDTIATRDDATEHAPVVDHALEPAGQPESEAAAVDSAAVAPLEETADSVEAPHEDRAPPSPKKVAPAKTIRSNPPAGPAVVKPASPSLFGVGGDGDAERGKVNAASYRAQVAAHLRRYRSYPDSARGAGISGTARVFFVVNAQGRVTNARLARSSGYAVLDRAAVDMVRRASPVPPIPPNLPQKTQSFDLPVRFSGR